MWLAILAVVCCILLVIIGALLVVRTNAKLLQSVDQTTKRASEDVRYALQREAETRREAAEFRDDATERIYQLEDEMEERNTIVAELRRLVKTRAAELEALEDQVQDEKNKEAAAAAAARRNHDLVDPRILVLRSRLTRLTDLVLDGRGKSAKAVACAELARAAHGLGVHATDSSSDDDSQQPSVTEPPSALCNITANYGGGGGEAEKLLEK